MCRKFSFEGCVNEGGGGLEGLEGEFEWHLSHHSNKLRSIFFSCIQILYVYLPKFLAKTLEISGNENVNVLGNPVKDHMPMISWEGYLHRRFKL